METMAKTFSKEDAQSATLKYFNNDALATSAICGKYLLKNTKGEFLELTPDDMHYRLAGEFARIEKKFGGNKSLSKEEIYKWLKNFNYIIPQGSPMYGIGNDHAVVSLSNCVVVESPNDDISAILNRGRDLANLFKRRCGVGIDISTLRPEGSPVSNSARTTTGAWSFADFYSYICRMIGQNGRRGALMITLDVRHPDIENFVMMKQDLRKVTGANVSIKIRDDFMEAVEADSTFELRWPVNSSNPTVVKVIKAKDLWEKIIHSATTTAEPGLMMWDNILRELPAQCYSDVGFETVTTNPCGEIPLSPYDSCRLISINLTNFVVNPYTKDAYFDFNKFSSCVQVAMRLSDDLVELELEKLASILEKVDTADEADLWKKLKNAAEIGRRTGLGTLGLADTLARLQIVYASKEGVSITDKIYESLKVNSYKQSVDLAQERGAFEAWDWHLEKNNDFLNRLPSKLIEKMSKYGRRNISILTNAPTGTCSIAAQTSSGIEPIFRLSYTRRKKLNHDELQKDADFTDELGDRWREFEVYHHAIQDFWNIQSKTPLQELPAYFITSDQIDWKGRIDMQAAIQKHIDHSISSTINLPKKTEPSTVDQLYTRAWKMGLKGVTIYVDGSRDGVLVTKQKNEAEISYKMAPKRPDILNCDIHRANIKGDDWTILVSLMEGKPYEIFGGLSEYVEIPKKHSEGTIRKRVRKTVASKYDLMIGDGGDEFLIKDIVSVFSNPNHTAFTRTISLSMRHGVPIQYLVEQLQKDKDADLFCFSRVIARVLKKYIVDGTKVSNGILQCNCENSNDRNIIYQEGCATCITCGYAKCG